MSITKFFLIVFLSHLFITPLFAEKIKIGVSTALTGDAASYGRDMKNIAQFANQELANNQYELVIEDDKCSGRDGVSVAQKLTAIDQVKYVIGFCSTTIMSAANIYGKAGTTAIAVIASAPKISELGSHIFRTWPSDDGAAKILAEYISSKHQKIGMVNAETEYAQGFAAAFDKYKGDLVTVSENYLETETDFRSLFTKMLNQKVEAIFLNSQTETLYLTLLRQLRKLDPKIQIYSAYWPATANIIAEAGSLNEGTIFVEMQSLDEILTPASIKLYEKFEQQYGKLATFRSMFYSTFEGFRAIHQAIQNSDNPNYLNENKFKGTLGEWSFDKNGDIQGLGFALWQIQDAKSVVFNP